MAENAAPARDSARMTGKLQTNRYLDGVATTQRSKAVEIG